MTIYKIRHKTTGLYSTGRLSPEFNETGKTWNKINHVRSHLTMLRKTLASGYYNDESNREIAEYLANVEVVAIIYQKIHETVYPA